MNSKNSKTSMFRIPRVFEIVASFVKSSLPPRRPTMIRRVGVLEHNLCRVMVFPMPSHMSRSFTIEFWMRPNLMNNISLTNYFFKLDFDTKNMKEFVLGLENTNCGQKLICSIGHHSLFSSDVPYVGWLHFSLSFQVGEEKDTLAYKIIVSRSTSHKKSLWDSEFAKKSMKKCFERKEVGFPLFINTEGRASRFILASPGICGGCFSDVRLWAFAFHRDPTPTLERKPQCEGRLKGNEDWLLHYWPLDEVSGSIAKNICTDRRASQDATRFAKMHEKQKDLIEKYNVFIQLSAANGSTDSHAKFGHFDDSETFFRSKSVPAFIDTEGSKGATMFALAYLFKHPTDNFGT